MTQERAVLAGGCFLGMQDLLRRYPGVISARVGYTGGDVPNATYRNRVAGDPLMSAISCPYDGTDRCQLTHGSWSATCAGICAGAICIQFNAAAR